MATMIDSRNGGSLASRRAMFGNKSQRSVTVAMDSRSTATQSSRVTRSQTQSQTPAQPRTFRRVPAATNAPDESRHKYEDAPATAVQAVPSSRTTKRESARRTPITIESPPPQRAVTESASQRATKKPQHRVETIETISTRPKPPPRRSGSPVEDSNISPVRDNPFLRNDRKKRRKFSLGAPKARSGQSDSDQSRTIGRGHRRRSSKIKSPHHAGRRAPRGPEPHELAHEDDSPTPPSPGMRSHAAARVFPPSSHRTDLSQRSPVVSAVVVTPLNPGRDEKETYRAPSPPAITNSFTNSQIASQFGKGLDDLEYVRLPRYPSPIPRILVELKKRFHACDGVRQEGIFISDPESKAQQHHTVAALIKSWFAELPRPLLIDVNPNAINAAMNKRLVPAALEQMPPRCVAILSWLWDLCADVDENSSINGVDAAKLSKVFGPIMITVTRRDLRGPRASVNALFASRLIVFMKRGILWRRLLRDG